MPASMYRRPRPLEVSFPSKQDLLKIIYAASARKRSRRCTIVRKRRLILQWEFIFLKEVRMTAPKDIISLSRGPDLEVPQGIQPCTIDPRSSFRDIRCHSCREFKSIYQSKSTEITVKNVIYPIGYSILNNSLILQKNSLKYHRYSAKILNF